MLYTFDDHFPFDLIRGRGAFISDYCCYFYISLSRHSYTDRHDYKARDCYLNNAASSSAIVCRPCRVFPQCRHLVPGGIHAGPPDLPRQPQSSRKKPQHSYYLCSSVCLYRALFSRRPLKYGVWQPDRQDSLNWPQKQHFPIQSIPTEVLLRGGLTQRHLPLQSGNW